MPDHNKSPHHGTPNRWAKDLLVETKAVLQIELRRAFEVTGCSNEVAEEAAYFAGLAIKNYVATYAKHLPVMAEVDPLNAKESTRMVWRDVK